MTTETKPRTALDVLTGTERQVLMAMATGLSNQGIGARMFLSAKTVESHIGAIFRKLRLDAEPSGNRRVQAVLVWVRADDRSAREASDFA